MIRIGAKILFGLTRCPLLSSQLDLAVETDEQFVRQIHKGIDDEARSHPTSAILEIERAITDVAR
jgi:hypothetical protein